jgi:nitric oxide reductase subunit C
VDFYFKGFIIILLTSLAAFTWLLYYSVTGDKLQKISDTAEKGQIVFEKKACIECHTIFGNGGYSGGDLTKVYSKYGDRTQLRNFLTDPPVLGGAKRKRHDRLNDKEANEMVDYFQFINSLNTGNWPPTPDYNLKGKGL